MKEHFRNRRWKWVSATAMLFMVQVTLANNISISNPSLVSQNQTTNLVNIKFSVSWENSFRVSISPNNWDAAWIFIKYRVVKASGGDGIWRHAKINTTGQVVPGGAALNITPEGSFLYRSANGYGTFSANDIELQWNYGTHVESGTADFIDDDDAIEVRVYGIEMVYVPGGFYHVGGGGGTNAFIQTAISSVNASTTGGYPTGISNSNANFPNGQRAFYCMKYEISQQQYVDFLNTLTYTQQAARTAVNPNSPPGTGALSYNNAYRNGIDIKISGKASTEPAEYACNGDGDASFSETGDGQWLACNFLSWGDLVAYFDWSGLRPMTELEYEKACRGSNYPEPGEFAWGTTAIQGATQITNAGQNNETFGNNGANACYNNLANIQGPLRVGAFAANSKSRAQSGATYFGIMEMSGNLWERIVTAGINPVFNGLHGNGVLNSAGNADVTNWPAPTTAAGSGFRGGGWFYIESTLRVTDRASATYVYTGRDRDNGGRGVRTAP